MYVQKNHKYFTSLPNNIYYRTLRYKNHSIYVQEFLEMKHKSIATDKISILGVIITYYVTNNSNIHIYVH